MMLIAARLLSGTDEVKANVAASYGVSVSQVTLYSPDVVQVRINQSTIQGTASFLDCGDICTNVTVTFPDRTLQFIVEDDLGGF